MKQFGRIGVLMGGYSSERPISLKSGRAVYDALKRQGCAVAALDILEKEPAKIAASLIEAKMDVAFIALHGHLGEDGTIQTILENIGVPYTGSGVEASRLALNKVLAQDLFKKNNIPVPAYITLSKQNFMTVEVALREFNSLPVVVKPACEGSSIGVSVVRQKEELAPAIERAWQYGDIVLLEQYIKGRELTVGILDQCPLPVIEICHRRDLFDFAAKYEAGMTEYIIPADLPHVLSLRLQETALKAHSVLGCQDLSRVDFMLDQEQNDYVLEVNTIPGFTATSLLPKAAKYSGIDFDQLCLKLIQLAYGKKNTAKDTTVRR